MRVMEIIKRMDGHFFHAHRHRGVVGEGPQEEVGELIVEDLVEFSVDGFVDHGVGGAGGLFEEAVDFFVFVADVVTVSA